MTHSKNKLEHIIKDNGTEIWKDSNENLHQHDDLPTEILPHGTEVYYKNGRLLREIGPAVKRPNGHEEWKTNENYLWHREDGATAILPNGERKYYINGKPVSYDEFREQQINRS